MMRLLKVGVPLTLVVLALALFCWWLLVYSVPPGLDAAGGGPITNSIGMKLVLIPAGKFLMGSARDEKGHHPSEEPQHEVVISQPFYMGVYEVTQGQYRQVMGNNPSFYSPRGEARDEVAGLDTDNFPVENVTWHDAQAFCQRLSALWRERAAGRVYRLPTEAEWEYACRAGTTTPSTRALR